MINNRETCFGNVSHFIAVFIASAHLNNNRVMFLGIKNKIEIDPILWQEIIDSIIGTDHLKLNVY